MINIASRLTSLAKMLRVYADVFVASQDILATMSFMCRNDERLKVRIPERNIKQVVPDLERLVEQCDHANLRKCREAAERLIETLRNNEPTYRVIGDVEYLRRRLMDDFEGVLFVVLSEKEGEHFDSKTGTFGDFSLEAFPNAAEDIGEASKCFALARYTASVFHLMRVMEFALQQLAVGLNVEIDPDKDYWYRILTKVNSAIEKLPSKTKTEAELKANYSACAAHLNNVRLAWRNDTMHPKRTYTEEEAADLFGHVRTFIRDLANVVSASE